VAFSDPLTLAVATVHTYVGGLAAQEANLPAQLPANSCVTSETPARERSLFACHGSRAAACGIFRAAALPAEADRLDVDCSAMTRS